MPPRSIQVCSIPHASMNPYISSINRELGRLGVTFAGPASTLEEIRKLLRPNLLLHFHWPSMSYGGRNRAEFESKTRAFVELLDHAKSLGCRIVWTAHNVFPHENPFPELDRLARQSFIEGCDHILVHCSAGQRELAARFRDLPPVTIAPHPHYGQEYPDPPSRDAARAELLIPQEAFVFLMFGLLRGYKNFPLAISAFRDAGVPNARLIVAGGTLAGDDSAALRRLVYGDDRIELRADRVPHDTVPAFFSAANVALFSYDRILASGSVALAQSMGRAIVAPRIGCLPDMVPDTCGVLYEAGSKESLATAMRRIAELDADELGRRGRLHAARQSPASFAATVFGIYQSLGRDGARPRTRAADAEA